MVAVIDAEGVELAYIGGLSEGGTMSTLFAVTRNPATEPSRVDAGSVRIKDQKCLLLCAHGRTALSRLRSFQHWT